MYSLNYFVFGPRCTTTTSETRAELARSMVMTAGLAFIACLLMLYFLGPASALGGLMAVVSVVRWALAVHPYFGRFTPAAILALRIWFWGIFLMPLPYYRCFIG